MAFPLIQDSEKGIVRTAQVQLEAKKSSHSKPAVPQCEVIFRPLLIFIMKTHSLELSIVIPVLNEEQQIRCLLTDLLRQQDVSFEVVISDGGSSDALEQVVADYVRFCPFPLRLVQGERGRGRQLNRGIAASKADHLLLLHADSRFFNPYALRRALDKLADFGCRPIAGRFALKFRRRRQTPHPGYYYYEWKARLPRAECIHGDQGFLLRRELFEQIGRFRENLPVMEDTDFAERLRQQGEWLLLPDEISTSARRFEAEGLWQRQLLNAMIMCFRSIGWEDFFSDAIAVYRQQGACSHLPLRPFFRQFVRSLRREPLRRRLEIWYRSGSYVRGHAWQLAFALDARRSYRQGLAVGQGQLRWVARFEPLFNLLTNNPGGHLLATMLLWMWFYTTWLWLFFTEPSTSALTRHHAADT
jgi:rSAM/selenodomain-associated transferase 2